MRFRKGLYQLEYDAENGPLSPVRRKTTMIIRRREGELGSHHTTGCLCWRKKCAAEVLQLFDASGHRRFLLPLAGTPFLLPLPLSRMALMHWLQAGRNLSGSFEIRALLRSEEVNSC
jgi:hypothetical protein